MSRWLPLAVVMLAGCGGDSGPSDPPPPPELTLSSVWCSLDAIASVDYEGSTRPSVAFAWWGFGRMSDGAETTLDSAVVRLGGETIQTIRGARRGSGILDSSVTSDGLNSLSVTCYREMRSGADSEEFGIYKLVTATFDAIHFFSQEPNLTGTAVGIHGQGDHEYLKLTDGTGSLTVRAGNKLITINDSDSGNLHYLEEVGAAPGEHWVFPTPPPPTFNQLIPVDADTDYRIVSVDSQQFLKDMAQQWNTLGTTQAPMPGTLKIVLYEGNPTCNKDWHPEYDAYDDCGDAETWFPGKPMTPEEIASFNTFIEDTQAVLDDPRIPWRPYTIEPILADTSSIREYVNSLNGIALADVKTPNTHVIIGTRGEPLREAGYTALKYQRLHYVIGSAATASGSKPSSFSNELQLFGSLGESLNYPICSIRDNEANMHPDCPFLLEDDNPTWFEMDKKMMAVVATYFARAQTQPNPFNVSLPEP